MLVSSFITKNLYVYVYLYYINKGKKVKKIIFLVFFYGVVMSNYGASRYAGMLGYGYFDNEILLNVSALPAQYTLEDGGLTTH